MQAQISIFLRVCNVKEKKKNKIENSDSNILVTTLVAQFIGVILVQYIPNA